jgi:hemolysin III
MNQTEHSTVSDLTTAPKPRLRGVLHEAAFAISLITGTALICLAEGAQARIAATVYAVSVALLFGTSAAYHRGPWDGRSREVMKRLDHSMIFILIAGTYTPFALLLLEGVTRWVVFGAVWGGAVLGVVLRIAVRRPARWLFVLLYLSMGWVALGVLPQLQDAGGWTIVILLLAGGLFYSLGAIVYALGRPDPFPSWFGFHEVFHAFTLLAFITYRWRCTAATCTCSCSRATSVVGSSHTKPRQTYAAPAGRPSASGPAVTTTAPGAVPRRATANRSGRSSTTTSAGPASSASPTAAAQPAKRACRLSSGTTVPTARSAAVR